MKLRPDKVNVSDVLLTQEVVKEQFKDWGFCDDGFDQKLKKDGKRLNVITASGHGYGNVGDEAQCGAALSRWKAAFPDCRVAVFSPNPCYTRPLHEVEVYWAPRVAWFEANTKEYYFSGGLEFEEKYEDLSRRVILTAYCRRFGIPINLLNDAESTVIDTLMQFDVLHISGGGILTGMTKSRLWENCLLLRVAQILGLKTMLTGHNIGVFKSIKDEKYTRVAIEACELVWLRDRGMSEKELVGIGVDKNLLRSTCDDALLCDSISNEELAGLMNKSSVNSQKPWISANFHYWGQDEGEREANARRFAYWCDFIADKYGVQVVMISMTPTDEAANEDVRSYMRNPATVLPYSPDYRVVRGVIRCSEMVFTMKHHPIVFAQGELVPIIGIALDDYYYRKNVGAMKNTGHERFVLDRDMFYSDSSEDVICELFDDIPKFKKELSQWVGGMKAIELEPYEIVGNMIVGAH